MVLALATLGKLAALLVRWRRAEPLVRRQLVCLLPTGPAARRRARPDVPDRGDRAVAAGRGRAAAGADLAVLRYRFADLDLYACTAARWGSLTGLAVAAQGRHRHGREQHGRAVNHRGCRSWARCIVALLEPGRAAGAARGLPTALRPPRRAVRRGHRARPAPHGGPHARGAPPDRRDHRRRAERALRAIRLTARTAPPPLRPSRAGGAAHRHGPCSRAPTGSRSGSCWWRRAAWTVRFPRRRCGCVARTSRARWRPRSSAPQRGGAGPGARPAGARAGGRTPQAPPRPARRRRLSARGYADAGRGGPPVRTRPTGRAAAARVGLARSWRRAAPRSAR